MSTVGPTVYETTEFDMAAYRVGVIVGSLAATSRNRRLAEALSSVAPTSLSLEPIEIGGLPLYTYDLDDDLPASARIFKTAVEACDGLIFVTPEYNRSIPAALKNAIEWGTRPHGQNSLAGRPACIIGTSPGKLSSAVAQAHLRVSLASCGLPVMTSPEAYIQFSDELIDDGEIAIESSRRFLASFMESYASFLTALSPR